MNGHVKRYNMSAPSNHMEFFSRNRSLFLPELLHLSANADEYLEIMSFISLRDCSKMPLKLYLEDIKRKSSRFRESFGCFNHSSKKSIFETVKTGTEKKRKKIVVQIFRNGFFCQLLLQSCENHIRFNLQTVHECTCEFSSIEFIKVGKNHHFFLKN